LKLDIAKLLHGILLTKGLVELAGGLGSPPGNFFPELKLPCTSRLNTSYFGLD
jgi:hypothetical protein